MPPSDCVHENARSRSDGCVKVRAGVFCKTKHQKRKIGISRFLQPCSIKMKATGDDNENIKLPGQSWRERREHERPRWPHSSVTLSWRCRMSGLLPPDTTSRSTTSYGISRQRQRPRHLNTTRVWLVMTTSWQITDHTLVHSNTSFIIALINRRYKQNGKELRLDTLRTKNKYQYSTCSIRNSAPTTAAAPWSSATPTFVWNEELGFDSKAIMKYTATKKIRKQKLKILSIEGLRTRCGKWNFQATSLPAVLEQCGEHVLLSRRVKAAK